jgi:hypothetical protein
MTTLALPAGIHIGPSAMPDYLGRFWSKVNKTPGQGPNGDCWIWTDYKLKGGYGLFRIGHMRVLVHRYAYHLAHPAVDLSLFCVLHRCDVPSCVRASHLFLGSKADNNHDRDAKGRQAKGERNGSAKLTQPQVQQIRALYASGSGTIRDLACLFGVGKSIISYIVRRELWN